MKIIAFVLIIFNLILFASEEAVFKSIHDIEYSKVLHKLIVFKYTNFSKVELKIKENLIGYLTFIEFEKNYTISEIYIYQSYRNLGYAKFLLSFTVQEIKNQQAKEIKVIPVPFEFVNGSMKCYSSDSDYDKYLSLYKLYRNCGFADDSIFMRIKFDNSENYTSN